MSNAILEAVACCTPLVVSNRAFNTDFLTEEVAEFVEPDDVIEIRRGILAALDSKRNAEQKEALVLFREQFSIERRIKRILNFAEGDAG
jgi:glycosyltransferase involved in cell wall biosynthesis